MTHPVDTDLPDRNADLADRLTDVTLTSFSANRNTVRPFESATLHWRVAGVVSGVRILLNNAQVDASGSLVVQLLHDGTYRLVAAAGPSARRTLGTVTVHVNEGSCVTTRLDNAWERMITAIRVNIEASGYYVRGTSSHPNPIIVEERDGKLWVDVSLSKDINNAPDPFITLQAFFALSVENGAVVPADVWTKGSVGLATWLEPFAEPSDAQKAEVRARAAALPDDLCRLLTTMAIDGNPDTRRIRRISVGQENGQSFMDTECCDIPPLLWDLGEAPAGDGREISPD